MRVENVHTSSLDLTDWVFESLHQVLRPFLHFLQSVGVLVEEPEVHHAERHQFQTLVELAQAQLDLLTELPFELSQSPGLLFQSLHLHEVVGEDLVKLSVLDSHLIQSQSHIFEVVLELEQRFNVEVRVLDFLPEEELFEVVSGFMDEVFDFQSFFSVELVFFDLHQLVVSFHGFFLQFDQEVVFDDFEFVY